MKLNAAQLKNREFNENQLAVGSPLRTLKGSTVKRCTLGVGKMIGGELYFHRDYAIHVLEQRDLQMLSDALPECPFDFTCIRFNLKTEAIALIECPDFDTAREPVVGRMCSILPDGEVKVSRFYNQIYHHKWTFVTNSYTHFDVAESWEWSKKWLSVLTETADGTNIERWEHQLEKFHLL